MLRKVFKGCHYCWTWLIPRMYLSNELHMSYDITFDDSAIYDITPEQMDVNKLCGFGYGLSCKFHHIDSDRFGWRWNLAEKRIEIVEYCYENEKRLSTKHIGWVKPNETFHVEMHTVLNDDKTRTTTFIFNNVNYTKTYKMRKNWRVKYDLGLYFGGNIAAPHKINVNYKKL